MEDEPTVERAELLAQLRRQAAQLWALREEQEAGRRTSVVRQVRDMQVEIDGLKQRLASRGRGRAPGGDDEETRWRRFLDEASPAAQGGDDEELRRGRQRLDQEEAQARAALHLQRAAQEALDEERAAREAERASLAAECLRHEAALARHEALQDTTRAAHTESAARLKQESEDLIRVQVQASANAAHAERRLQESHGAEVQRHREEAARLEERFAGEARAEAARVREGLGRELAEALKGATQLSAEHATERSMCGHFEREAEQACHAELQARAAHHDADAEGHTYVEEAKRRLQAEGRLHKMQTELVTAQQWFEKRLDSVDAERARVEELSQTAVQRFREESRLLREEHGQTERRMSEAEQSVEHAESRLSREFEDLQAALQRAQAELRDASRGAEEMRFVKAELEGERQRARTAEEQAAEFSKLLEALRSDNRDAASAQQAAQVAATHQEAEKQRELELSRQRAEELQKRLDVTDQETQKQLEMARVREEALQETCRSLQDEAKQMAEAAQLREENAHQDAEAARLREADLQRSVAAARQQINELHGEILRGVEQTRAREVELQQALQAARTREQEMQHARDIAQTREKEMQRSLEIARTHEAELRRDLDNVRSELWRGMEADKAREAGLQATCRRLEAEREAEKVRAVELQGTCQKLESERQRDLEHAKAQREREAEVAKHREADLQGQVEAAQAEAGRERDATREKLRGEAAAVQLLHEAQLSATHVEAELERLRVERRSNESQAEAQLEAMRQEAAQARLEHKKLLGTLAQERNHKQGEAVFIGDRIQEMSTQMLAVDQEMSDFQEMLAHVSKVASAEPRSPPRSALRHGTWAWPRSPALPGAGQPVPRLLVGDLPEGAGADANAGGDLLADVGGASEKKGSSSSSTAGSRSPTRRTSGASGEPEAEAEAPGASPSPVSPGPARRTTGAPRSAGAGKAKVVIGSTEKGEKPGRDKPNPLPDKPLMVAAAEQPGKEPEPAAEPQDDVPNRTELSVIADLSLCSEDSAIGGGGVGGSGACGVSAEQRNLAKVDGGSEDGRRPLLDPARDAPSAQRSSKLERTLDEAMRLLSTPTADRSRAGTCSPGPTGGRRSAFNIEQSLDTALRSATNSPLAAGARPSPRSSAARRRCASLPRPPGPALAPGGGAAAGAGGGGRSPVAAPRCFGRGPGGDGAPAGGGLELTQH